MQDPLALTYHTDCFCLPAFFTVKKLSLSPGYTKHGNSGENPHISNGSRIGTMVYSLNSSAEPRYIRSIRSQQQQQQQYCSHPRVTRSLSRVCAGGYVKLSAVMGLFWSRNEDDGDSAGARRNGKFAADEVWFAFFYACF